LAFREYSFNAPFLSGEITTGFFKLGGLYFIFKLFSLFKEGTPPGDVFPPFRGSLPNKKGVEGLKLLSRNTPLCVDYTIYRGVMGP